MTNAVPTLSPTEARQSIVSIIASCAEVPAETIRDHESLQRHGVDSLAGVNIAYEIGLLCGRDVPAYLITEFDTVDKLVSYVLRTRP